MKKQAISIHNTDCIQGMHDMPNNTVDLVFADPPFNTRYQYDKYVDDLIPEQYLKWSRVWLQHAYRALAPTGTLWLAIGDEFVAELKVLADSVGLHLRSWVIWYYTFGVNCKNGFSRSHTHLLHFVKDANKFTFNFDAVGVPSARQQIYKDKRAKQGGRTPDNTWILRPQEEDGLFSPDSDTWHVPRVCGTFKERTNFHTCQMPEALLHRVIAACSNRGDLVLDPFVGSGTTAVVAKRLKRRFKGFEISEQYAEKARNRVNATTEALT